MVVRTYRLLVNLAHLRPESGSRNMDSVHVVQFLGSCQCERLLPY